MRVRPRLKVLYLLTVAIGALAIRDPIAVGLLAGLQIGACLSVGVEARRLARAVRKLALFIVCLAIVMALLPGGRVGPESIRPLSLGPITLNVNIEGLELAGWMALRIVTVVFASMAVRSSGGPGELTAALTSIGLPRTVSLAMDATLSLIEDEDVGRRGAGGGGGGGPGRGGGGGEIAPEQPSRREAIRRYVSAVVHADGETLAAPLTRAVDKAEHRIRSEHPELPEDKARDVAVIAGVTAVMMSMKMLKTLPGVPVAPGHKNAVLLPLYLLASELTRSRFGATSCGVTMGILSFLMGDGKYGIFEILKHITPGVLTDLLYPPLRRAFSPTVLVLAAFGVVLAAGRLSTELVVALCLGVPASFYAVIGALAITHLVAGALSGFVSRVLINSVDRLRARETQSDDSDAAETDFRGIEGAKTP